MKKPNKFAGLGLAVDKPFRLVLVWPVTNKPIKDKDGKESYVDVWSAESDVARKYHRDLAQRRIENGDAGPRSIEELEAADISRLAALTADWYLVNPDGTPTDVPFSPDNARDLYAAAATTWIKDQVENATVQRRNFAPPLSTN